MKGAHVTPAEAAKIANTLGAGSAVGMHWGTISLTPEDPFDAPDLFQAAAKTTVGSLQRALTLKVGETRNLSAHDLTPE